MSDTTITAEERAEIRRIAASKSFVTFKYDINEKLTRLIEALEQAEAQLEAALQVNAKSQAEVTADMLNAMMAGITGQKETVHVQVGGYQCPYCNNVSKTIEAATAHDAICPKHPAVMRAENAESNVARLTKMVDWLAEMLAARCEELPCVGSGGSDCCYTGKKECETAENFSFATCWTACARGKSEKF